MRILLFAFGPTTNVDNKTSQHSLQPIASPQPHRLDATGTEDVSHRQAPDIMTSAQHSCAATETADGRTKSRSMTNVRAGIHCGKKKCRDCTPTLSLRNLLTPAGGSHTTLNRRYSNVETLLLGNRRSSSSTLSAQSSTYCDYRSIPAEYQPIYGRNLTPYDNTTRRLGHSSSRSSSHIDTQQAVTSHALPPHQHQHQHQQRQAEDGSQGHYCSHDCSSSGGSQSADSRNLSVRNISICVPQIRLDGVACPPSTSSSQLNDVVSTDAYDTLPAITLPPTTEGVSVGGLDSARSYDRAVSEPTTPTAGYKHMLDPAHKAFIMTNNNNACTSPQQQSVFSVFNNNAINEHSCDDENSDDVSCRRHDDNVSEQQQYEQINVTTSSINNHRDVTYQQRRYLGVNGGTDVSKLRRCSNFSMLSDTSYAFLGVSKRFISSLMRRVGFQVITNVLYIRTDTNQCHVVMPRFRFFRVVYVIAVPFTDQKQITALKGRRIALFSVKRSQNHR